MPGAAAERHLVDVELHRDRVEVEPSVRPDSSAASRQRRRRQVAVARLDVAAELEPRPRLRVQGQQHLAAVGGDHERAGRQVVGPAGAVQPSG